RHRPLPAVHDGRGAGLSGAARDRLSRAAAPRPAADRLVAARLRAVGHRRAAVRRRRGLGPLRRWRRRCPDPRRRTAAAVQEPLSARRFRRNDGLQPLGRARGHLRAAHDTAVPAVPARSRRDRADPGRIARRSSGGHYHATPAPPPRRSALTITDRPGDSLAVHGLRVAGRVLRNPTTSQLYTAAIDRGEGLLAEDGPLVVDTGRFTGRSPKD